MKKHLKRLRSKKTRRKLKYLSRHPFVVPVSTFVVMFFATLIVLVMMGGQTIGASDTRVVRLYVEGVSRVIPTRADTVADLLERLDIAIAEKDIVEPSLDAEITDDNFQINVYKARPVLIEDTGKKIVTLTAEPAPRAVAKAAGLEVYPEDIVERRPLPELDPAEIIKEGGIEERIVIERATPVDLNIFGTQVSVRTHAETINDLLSERGLDNVTVLPNRETVLEKDLAIFVTEPGKTLRVVQEEIAFEEEVREDPGLTFGEVRIVQSGVAGRRAVVYETAADGNETIFNEVVVRQPVKQIIVRGTKPPTVIVAGDHASLMSQAGIPAAEHGSAEFIISRESGWRLNARNPSGCLGLGQACPGSKLVNVCPNYANDPVCQLRFFSSYVNSRYGGWNGAYQFWAVNHWY